MKKLSWLSILLVLTGCTNLLEENPSMKVSESYFATIESSDSRTYLDEQVRLRWTAEDCISVFSQTTDNLEYIFTGETGDNAGGFTLKSENNNLTGNSVDYHYAVYPYSSTTQLDDTELFFNVTLPSEQNYVNKSFGLGANTMVAVSENNKFNFKNIGSFLRVRLYGENTSVSSITITSKGEQAIAGSAKVTAVLNGVPTCELTGTDKSIRLVCSDPVAISTNAESPTDFWIVVPPVTLQDGFSVCVETTDGDSKVFDIDTPITFERNKYYDLKRDLSTAIPYVTFTATQPQMLKMSKVVSTLQYSENNGVWKNFEENTGYISFGGENGSLRLRGKSSIGTATGYSNYTDYSHFIFSNTSVDVSCSGDIRTLVDYDNYKNANTENARFCHLFESCSNLISAPKLPATNLATSCYYGMFYGCNKLVNAPELPATVLSNYCYSNMFQLCGLVTAPNLPATNLAAYCYKDMFKGCADLVNAPELSAQTLADGCYSGMFTYCEGLILAPELPATTLEWLCYEYMFWGCTSLVNAPSLQATSLSSGCYLGMFKGCTSLINAPELPATTLTKQCYESMFEECTSLITAPVLPANSLAENAYDRLFYGCSSLNSITMLATMNIGSNVDDWVVGVAKNGTFIKSSNLSDNTALNYRPSGWTIKNYESQ